MQMEAILGLCDRIQGRPTFFEVSFDSESCKDTKVTRYALGLMFNP